MLSLSIGPLAFPLGPLIVLVAAGLAAWSARRVAPISQKSRAEGAIWQALGFGLVAARLTHVALNWQAYQDHPWSVIDLRDGGWLTSAGLAVAAAWIAVRVRPRSAARRAMLAGALVGLTIWTLANAGLRWSEGMNLARSVPDVQVTNLESGQISSLSSVIQGKPAIINLWASWCGPCRAEMPLLASAQKENSGIRLIFLNHRETATRIQNYLRREGLRLENVWIDSSGLFGDALGSAGLPTTGFYDASGRKVGAHFGVLNAASLKVRIKQLTQPR